MVPYVPDSTSPSQRPATASTTGDTSGAVDRTRAHQIVVNLPQGFDPERHQDVLLAKIAEQHGPGYEIVSINLAESKAVAYRQPQVAEVKVGAKTIDVRLARGTKPADGPKVDAKLADQHQGWYMVRFEPFLGFATLAQLTPAELRCRGALATALGVQPWDVGVTSRPDGGFEVELPNKYQPRHADKIQEVASEVVGREGWYAEIDAQALKASIIPSEPPTFPASIPTPLKHVATSGPDAFPIGRALPEPGQSLGHELIANWADSAFILLGGVPKGGKTQVVISAIFHGLANGCELVIIDDEDKAADYREFTRYCRRGGWGVESPQHRVASLGLVNEEIKRRAAILVEKGLNNWLDMKPAERFAPILVVVDELSLIVPKDPPLKSLPKDHPMRLEVDQANIAKDILLKSINDIVAKARFVGVRMILASQILNEKTGAGPTLRGKFGNFILMGASQPESSRSQVFANPKEIPYVPLNVASDGTAARGVGVTSLWGEMPAVFKGYYRPTSELLEFLRSMNLPTRNDTTPSAAEIDRFMPVIEDDLDDRGPAPVRGGERAPSGRLASEVAREMGDDVSWMYDEDGKKRSGYDKANAARAAVVRGAKTPPPQPAAKVIPTGETAPPWDTDTAPAVRGADDFL